MKGVPGEPEAEGLIEEFPSVKIIYGWSNAAINTGSTR
jgi:hypothetical protein